MRLQYVVLLLFLGVQLGGCSLSGETTKPGEEKTAVKPETAPPDTSKPDSNESDSKGPEAKQAADNTPPVSPPANAKPSTDTGNEVTANSPTSAECLILFDEGTGNYSPLLNKERNQYHFKSCQPGQPTPCEKKTKIETGQEVQQKLVVSMSKQDVQTLKTQTKELAEVITVPNSPELDRKVQELQRTLNAALEGVKGVLPNPPTPSLRDNMIGLILEANPAEKEVLVKYLKKREILLGGVHDGKQVDLGDWNPNEKKWSTLNTSAKSYLSSSDLMGGCPPEPERVLVPLTDLP